MFNGVDAAVIGVDIVVAVGIECAVGIAQGVVVAATTKLIVRVPVGKLKSASTARIVAIVRDKRPLALVGAVDPANLVLDAVVLARGYAKVDSCVDGGDADAQESAGSGSGLHVDRGIGARLCKWMLSGGDDGWIVVYLE